MFTLTNDYEGKLFPFVPMGILQMYENALKKRVPDQPPLSERLVNNIMCFMNVYASAGRTAIDFILMKAYIEPLPA